MKIGYSLDEYQECGIKLPVIITLPKKTSNILIAGKSGSGKSLSGLRYIHDMLSSGESRIFISDFKAGEEYEALEGSPAYAPGQDAIEMIEKYYQFFTTVRENRIRLKRHYTLVIEEYSGLLSWCETQEKKLRSEVMRMVGELLAVGRGLNIGTMLIVQRADASFFSAGARDQFQCMITFGRCSAEQFRMLGYAGEMEENPTGSFKAGQALALIDGQEDVQKIIVPWVKNPETMYRNIRLHLDRQPTLTELIRAAAEGDSARR